MSLDLTKETESNLNILKYLENTPDSKILTDVCRKIRILLYTQRRAKR